MEEHPYATIQSQYMQHWITKLRCNGAGQWNIPQHHIRLHHIGTHPVGEWALYDVRDMPETFPGYYVMAGDCYRGWCLLVKRHNENERQPHHPPSPASSALDSENTRRQE